MPEPPSAPGPFQDIRHAPDHGYEAPDHYRDARVIAYRDLARRPLDAARSVIINGEAIDPSALFDADETSGIAPPASIEGQPGTIVLTYDEKRMRWMAPAHGI